MSEFIKTSKDGPVLTITLNRPAVLNALNAPACNQLSKALDDYIEDDSLWVAIITGEGRAFCSGHDLLEGFDEPMPDTGWAGLSRRYDLFKPLIAAVNGLAMGGGWEIALACDVVVADERARFALPEPRVGFAALGGGANRLPLRMPWHIAMGLMLTGNSIDAQHAHRLGVVNEVAPAGDVLTVARRYAADMLRCSPLALQATKRLAIASVEPETRQEDLYALSLSLADEINTLEDTKEGVAAFAEKRAPVWKGK